MTEISRRFTTLASTLVVLSAPAAAAESLTATSNLADGRWVGRDHRVEITLNRTLDPAGERVAVMIGDADWTDLFTSAPASLAYRPGPLPLPAGESLLVAYVVSRTNGWNEIGRWTLRVLTPAGFERVELAPKLDVANKGQLAEDLRGSTNAARGTFQDFTLNIGLRTLHARNGVFSTQVNVVGVSNRQEALRFGRTPHAAPRLDLADYLVSAEGKRARLAAGHMTFNPQRHLVSAFSSRGLSGTFRVPRIDLTAAAVNATAIVGFSNVLGVATPEHRVGLLSAAGELGARPGTARVEATAVRGARLPLSGFTQGQINDAETSRGGAVRFLSASAGGRLRVDAGAAWSRFVNVNDPLLSQGVSLVSARERTRAAEYADVGMDLLHGVRLWKPLSLTASYRFERVEPLYRSISAPGVRADLLSNTAELNATLDQISAQISHSSSHDNLGKVSSLLTTDTETTNAVVTIPAWMFRDGGEPAVWLPLVSVTFSRILQAGRGIPANGGFADASQVPNQISGNRVVQAAWNGSQWRAVYALNQTVQDNRQPGREQADFVTFVHQITLGRELQRVLDVSVDLALERATNREVQRTGRTRRLGLNSRWRIARLSTLTAVVSRTSMREPATSRNDSLDANVQFLQRVPLPGLLRREAQFFIRSTWQSNDFADLLFGATQARRSWILNSGVTVKLF